MNINMWYDGLLKQKPIIRIWIWMSSKWSSGLWLWIYDVYCYWCDDNMMCTYSLMKYWITGMRNNPCTENCYLKKFQINESTGLCPLIKSTKIMYLRWKLFLIKNINMIVWMVIENCWKLPLLLCRYTIQGNGYILASVQTYIMGCDCEFKTFTISVVLIILCAVLILWKFKLRNGK